MVRVAERMHRLGSESAFKTLSRVHELRRQGRDIINLGIGAPDFAPPSNVIEAGRQALLDGWHSYTPAKGLIELRQAIAADIETTSRVNVDPENILVTPGGKPTMFFALLMLGGPGAQVLYPDPGFPIYRSMIEFSGAEPVPIPLSAEAGFEIDPEQLLSLVNEKTSLVILNHPGNPTGGTARREVLQALADGLADYPDVFVLSDEIYSRFVFDGHEHASMVEFESVRDRLILLNGWSKSHAMTGWRLGWGLWPTSLIAHAERLQINSNSCAAAATQIAGIEALTGDQREVEEMIVEFDKRRLFLFEALSKIDALELSKPQGAFYVFPNVSSLGLTSDEVEDRLLEEAGVAVLSGAGFGRGGEGFVRISYVEPTDVLQEAVNRIAGFIESL